MAIRFPKRPCDSCNKKRIGCYENCSQFLSWHDICEESYKKLELNKFFSIMNDNQKKNAREKLKIYHEARKIGETILEAVCCDEKRGKYVYASIPLFEQYPWNELMVRRDYSTAWEYDKKIAECFYTVEEIISAKKEFERLMRNAERKNND